MREEADVVLAIGLFSQKEIAKKLGVSQSSLSRHHKNHRREVVFSYWDEFLAQIREVFVEQTAPLVEELRPRPTLHRAFANAGLVSEGQRTAMLDVLVKGLVEREAWATASTFMRIAGFDADTADSTVAALAENGGVPFDVVMLELLLLRDEGEGENGG